MATAAVVWVDIGTQRAVAGVWLMYGLYIVEQVDGEVTRRCSDGGGLVSSRPSVVSRHHCRSINASSLYRTARESLYSQIGPTTTTRGDATLGDGRESLLSGQTRTVNRLDTI